MRIQVTQDHIDAGVRLYCSKCPVALAIAGAIGSDPHDIQTIGSYIQTDGSFSLINGERFDHPDGVSTFIHNFDDGKPVEPFEFDLPIDHLLEA